MQVLSRHRLKQVLVTVFAFGHDRRRHRGADEFLAGVGQAPALALEDQADDLGHDVMLAL